MLLQSLISMKYKGKGNIKEYIMEMSYIASKLKALKLELSDNLLVHLEERLKQDRIESAHLASTSKDKGKKRKNNEVLKTAAYILNRVLTKVAAKTRYDYELWTSKKPILKHFHIWGCLAKAGPYMPHEKKLDSKIVSNYFIGYSERSRGYKFYDPTLRSIFETGTATFFEDVEFGGRNKVRNIVFEEESISIPTIAFDNVQFSIPVIDQKVNPDPQLDNVDQPLIQDEVIVSEEQTQQPQEPVTLRRSTRERRNAISDDFFIFLQEHEEDIGMVEDDPINFHQAMQGSNSQKWIDAMNEEYKSMQDNKCLDTQKIMATLSKIATSDRHGENSPYFDGWKAYDRNPFYPTQNPDGVIQMGLAENQLCFDLIKEWISKNPSASICSAEGVDEFKDIANFQDYHGLPEFRQAVAKFMSKARAGRVTFDPQRVVMAGGATGANELITFCIADPGDAFLVPSPYYPAFDCDLGWRTGVKIVPVNCYSSNNFQITIEALEEAYKKAREANINVKGLIITNPSNPLGTTLHRDT
ncbi:hypothetical protein LWI29_022610 [Acer saccharum]|uniref:1-aminocyclopropane-1-carboxylate synthase n=1 Tax=Acer saccharum TaxID=4024 RepID=A0AA39RWV4_ACESA|nr:hypothetical protein LWI29_022610 [Acer saccharum]